VGKIPGVPHLRAVRALERAGFRIAREGKHIVMTDGSRILTIPRNNPVNAYPIFYSAASGIVGAQGLRNWHARRGTRPDSSVRIS